MKRAIKSAYNAVIYKVKFLVTAAAFTAASVVIPVIGAHNATVFALPSEVLSVSVSCTNDVAVLDVVGYNNSASDVTVIYSTAYGVGPLHTVSAGAVDSWPVNTGVSNLPAGSISAEVNGTPGAFTASYGAQNCDTHAPSTPVITSPANNAFLKGTDFLKIDWNDSTDLIGTTGYEYEAATDSAFTSPFPTLYPVISEQATTGTPEGTYYYHVRAVDAANNKSNWSTTQVVTIDNTAPVVTTPTVEASLVSGTTAVTLNTTEPNPAAYNIRILNLDGTPVSVGGINLGAFQSPATGPSLTYNWNTTQVADGSYRIQYTARDKANNSTTLFRNVTVDNTVPTVSISAPAVNQFLKGYVVNISGTATDNHFNYYHCFVTNSGGSEVGTRNAQCQTTWVAGTPFVSALTPTTTGQPSGILGSVQLPGNSPNGTYTVHVIGKDKLGNTTEVTQSFVLDNTKPVVTVNTPNGTYNPTTVSVSASDNNFLQLITGNIYNSNNTTLIRGCSQNVSALNAPIYTLLCPSTGLADGTYTIRANASDKAGNLSSTVSSTQFIIDTVAPTTTVKNIVTTDRTPTLSGTTNDKNASISVALSGVAGSLPAVVSQTVNGSGSYDWSATSSLIDAGLYTITATSTDLAGNSSTATGDLEIQKTDVTITANNLTKVYGDANPTFTYTVSALPYGEDESVLGAISCTPIAEDSNVGTYTITCTAPGNVNYNIVSVDGSLEITKAPVIVTADNQTRVYGDANPARTFAATGLKYSQDKSVLGVTCATTAVATSTVAGSPYAITCSGDNNANYNVSYVAGSLTVTPAPVTVTAANKSKTYGANNPSLTFSSVGRKNGQGQGVLGVTCATTAVNASPAGTYPITCSGSTNTNYAVTYNAGTLTINKASLLVFAPSKTRVYGDTNPAFNPTYAGFVNGDSASSLTTAPNCSTTANATSPVIGFYLVTCGSGASGNYNFIYVPGLLVITRAPVTITADDATKVYGEANPSFTYSVSGLKNSQLPSVLGTIECTTSADVFSSVGDYDINCARTSGQNFNYAYTFEKGTLSITPAVLNVTATDQTRVYGEANPMLGLAYTGFVNGDDASSLIVEPTCSTMADLTSPVGTYPVTCTGGTADNYSFTYTAGILTVTKAQLIVTAQNQTRTQGTANPTLSYIVSGFVNGDTASVLTSPVTCITTADTNSTQGTYPINCSGAVSDNYSFVYTDAELLVTLAPVTVNRTVARLAAAPQVDDSLVLSETTTAPNGSTSGEVKSDDDSNNKTNRPAVAIDSNKFLGLGWWWLPLLLTLAGASYGYARYRVR